MQKVVDVTKSFLCLHVSTRHVLLFNSFRLPYLNPFSWGWWVWGNSLGSVFPVAGEALAVQRWFQCATCKVTVDLATAFPLPAYVVSEPDDSYSLQGKNYRAGICCWVDYGEMSRHMWVIPASMKMQPCGVWASPCLQWSHSLGIAVAVLSQLFLPRWCGCALADTWSTHLGRSLCWDHLHSYLMCSDLSVT